MLCRGSDSRDDDERLENSLSISEENPEERPEAPSPDLPDSPLPREIPESLVPRAEG